jgi:hypothetical protein
MLGRATWTRSGITLTEILILGVGVVSLATLFPLGLLRLRDAQRASRSGFLIESAAAEMEARSLLNKSTFLNSYLSPWNNFTAYTKAPYDPFIQDTPLPGTPADPFGTPGGVYRGYSRSASAYGSLSPRPGPGLPIAYDPLWRYVVGLTDFNHAYLDPVLNPVVEARFGSGIGFVRPDPSDNLTASAWGLQRLTNFNPKLTYNPTNIPNNPNYAPVSGPVIFAAATVPDIFVSPEDIVTQGATGTQQATGASSVVPEMHQDTPTGPIYFNNDWRFSWMFTGQQSDANNGTVFDGDIVIFENRPFGIDQVNSPLPGVGQVPAAAGETVVEAVFGYSTRVLNVLNGVVITGLPAGTGYGQAADRVVLLRWPTSMPDPEVKVGNWIADVTYERNAVTEANRRNPTGADFPLQRCFWYQVVKRTDPGPDPISPATYRAMTVWVSTPLKAKTLMDSSTKQPYHVNAALVCPYVVNVFPRTIYSR